MSLTNFDVAFLKLDTITSIDYLSQSLLLMGNFSLRNLIIPSALAIVWILVIVVSCSGEDALIKR